MTTLLVLVGLTQAHNWIHSNSRAIKASTIQPAPAKQTHRVPHLRVGRGQEFAFEWATGHVGSEYFFVVLAAKHEDKLKKHNPTSLKEYLDNAPATATTYSGDHWNKIHVQCSSQGGGCDTSPYQTELTAGDAQFFERPESWGNPEKRLFKYKASDVKQDKRVAYKSDKYYWIESVHHFMVSVNKAGEWDLARFVIDGREPDTEYIIHMVWRGYRDVIDIDLLHQDSVDIYGQADPDFPAWKKVDHCQYRNYKKINKKSGKAKTTQCMFIKNTHRDVQQCLRLCETKNNCEAVNIVPLKNPKEVYHQDDVNIPWNDQNCDEWHKDRYADDTLVCYGFIPKLPKGGNKDVGSFWTVVDNDPEDPVFYSSCYRHEPTWTFEGFTAPTESKPPAISWKVGDKCLSCDNVKENSKSSFNTLNWWSIADECKKCF